MEWRIFSVGIGGKMNLWEEHRDLCHAIGPELVHFQCVDALIGLSVDQFQVGYMAAA